MLTHFPALAGEARKCPMADAAGQGRFARSGRLWMREGCRGAGVQAGSCRSALEAALAVAGFLQRFFKVVTHAIGSILKCCSGQMGVTLRY
jgi:hypothetical protein